MLFINKYMYIFSILYGNHEAGTKNTLYKDLKREGGDSRDESSCREAPRTKKGTAGVQQFPPQNLKFQDSCGMPT